ncbi:diguanylate cyclase [Alishewanella sp. d11]|uniref:diguanylate cyclase n=1 Tax=Alishewanella sp. d11 TaxID=3414030 RepID=UPI003BF7AE82
MRKPTTYLLICSLCGLLVLSSEIKADEHADGQIVVVDSLLQTDPALEQQLDDILALQLTDPQAASQQLAAVLAAMQQQTPVETKVRAITYQLFNALYANDTQATEQILTKLQQFKTANLPLNARIEIQAAELEVDVIQNRLNQAYLKAEEIQAVISDISNPRIRYWVNALLGRLFRIDSQYDKALKHYDLALDALSTTSDSRQFIRRAYLSQQMAQVYAEQKNWPAAKDLLEKLYEETKRNNAESLLPDIYITLGFVLAAQQDFTAAADIYQRGLILSRKNKQQNLAITFMNNLGSIYIEHGEIAKANEIFQQALQEAEALSDEENIQLLKFNIGYAQVLAGEHEAGIAQMLDTLTFYQKRNYKPEMEDILGWLAKAYKAMGDFKMQAATLEQQMQLREEIMAAEREKNTQTLQARYDLKSQNQQITILQQQNSLQEELLKNRKLQQTITLLFVVIMLIASALLINLYRKVRKTNKKLKEVNKQLEFQSLRDPLTGLLNRRAMQEKMAARHASEEKSACGLLILDIDFFKQINDNYGHAAGDKVLIEISHRLNMLVKNDEMLIRWGGEEFLMVLDSSSCAAIDALCQRILTTISATSIMYEGKSIDVTISGGFINLPFAGVAEQQLNWERVLQIADMALYLSKVNGRNQITAIDGLTVPFAQAEPHLQSDLNGAIREKQIQYHVVNG